MDLVRFCSSFSGAVALPKVAHFRLLDLLGAVGVELVGVYCKATEAGFMQQSPQ